MISAEHYAAAEAWLLKAQNEYRDYGPSETAKYCTAQAQVHAVLALTATLRERT